MKKMLAVLLTIAMLLPSLTTVFAASVGQVSVSPVLTNEKTETASIGTKTTAGEKRNVEFTQNKDAVELYGFSSYYDGGTADTFYGFVRFMSNAPETVEFLNGYYEKAFVAGEYVPDVQAIFAVRNLGAAYSFMRIDAITFAETEIKAYGAFSFMDMAFDISSGVMYGIKETTLYTIDLTTGDYTEVGATGAPATLFTLACSDAGVLYSIDQGGSLYTLDKATGTATLVGSTGVTVSFLQSMTWDHVNGGLYWANCNQNDGILYSVDPATAAVTAIGNIHGANMEVTCLFTKAASTGDPVAVTGVNLVPAAAILKVGKTLSLSAQVQPWNATDRGVSWVSSNPAVATVNESGVVSAIANGEATITVTTVDGGFTATCVITVPDTAEIDAAFDAAVNAPGATYHFVNDDAYPWEPVTVGERNAVKSTNTGVHGSQASFTTGPINMFRGNTVSFDWFTSCEIGYDGIVFLVNGQNTASFTRMSTDFAHYVYQIPADGEYTFAWFYIKDSSGSQGEDCGYIDNVAFDVTPPGPVTGVTLTPATVDLFQGQTAQLTATIVPSSALDIGMTFSTSDANVATVNETGLVTAREAGTAIITVTTHDGGFTATSTINVTSTEELMAGVNAALNVEGGTHSFAMDMVNMWATDATTFAGRNVAHSTTVALGGTSTSITLIATTDGTELIAFDWMVSSEANYDKAIFAIDGVEQARISGTTMTDFATVVFDAGTAGEHTYTWTYTKDSSVNKGQDMLWLDNIAITVAPEPQSVNMNATAKVHLGQTMKLNAAVVPSYATDTTLTYTTSDATKVTIDENGFITGVAEGTATITATAINGVNATCVVTVFNTLPSPDGKLYGFVVGPAGLTENLAGLVRIDPSMGTAEGVMDYPGQIFAAEYYNGVTYAFDNLTKEFITFDAVTGELLSRVAVSEIAYDMTYDYTTNTMYALFGGEERGLATVNLATGELTHIGLMPQTSVIVTLAADNLGKLYGVGLSTGIFYEIDKETVECIEIGNTTAGEVLYVQSMTYSIEADTIYWAGYTKTPIKGGFLYSIDRATGVATTVIDGQIGEICGLMAFNDGSITPPDPTAVTGVSIDPTTIDLEWGGNAKLRAIIEPENATNRRVEWSSSDPMVATVDNKGNIHGFGAGSATITVTTLDGGFTATCAVTVGESPYPPVEPGKAMIMLSVGEVWTDGSGYQMLLDSTHSLFGTTIPESGALTPGGDVSDEIYNLFDYKIPETADGVLTTENIVQNNESLYIVVDAGIYDFCITNPTPGDRMWIAKSDGGSVGRGDDFVVEEGYIYEFSIELRGQNDFVTMTLGYIGTTGSEPTYDPGDANLDGVVNTGDAAFLLRSFIGLEVLSDEGRAVSDVNNDGNVNTGDAAMILEMCIN
ncbi:MAG: Ig-like domain-containing protein [Clostridia bacterium]